MPYYCFDKCNSVALERVARQADKLGLGLKEGELTKGVGREKQWLVEDYSVAKKVIGVYYQPDNQETPLVLQTVPSVDHKDREIKKLIRRLYSVSGSENIFDGSFEKMDIFKILGRATKVQRHQIKEHKHKLDYVGKNVSKRYFIKKC